MKKQIVNVLKLIFFFGLGLLLVYLSVKNLTNQEKFEIFESFRNANYFWVILVIILGILSHVSRSIRWVMLMETMGYKPRLKQTFYAVMVGYLVNMALPRVGEVSRCGLMDRYEKVPFNKALGTVFTERAFDLIILILIFASTFFIEYNHINEYLNEILFPKMSMKSETLFTVGIWGGISFIVFLIMSLYFFNKFKHIAWVDKVKQLLIGFWQGLKSLTLVKSPVWFIFHTIFIWVMYFLMLYICFFCFPETSSLSLGAGLSSLAIGSIAIMVTPGGIGLYPITIRGILGLYAISPTTGFALGWIAWTSQTIMIVSVGFFSMFMLHFTKPRNTQIDDSSAIH